MRIGRYGISIKRWKKQIEGFLQKERESENSSDPSDAQQAAAALTATQVLLDKAEKSVILLVALLGQVKSEWKEPDDRILGRVVRSPPRERGVGMCRFTEDWAVFEVGREKLGRRFRGNMLDLGTRMTPEEFTLKCSVSRGLDPNWTFEFPEDRLLPLRGVLTDDLMRSPDMWDSESEGDPCLLVVKNGAATGTTLGRANGVFSVVRDHSNGISGCQTSLEWCIINYDSKSSSFSKPGDSSAIIADIRGRIGGMLTGGAGTSEASAGCDVSYATPFWWLIERVRMSGSPDAHLDVRE